MGIFFRNSISITYLHRKFQFQKLGRAYLIPSPFNEVPVFIYDELINIVIKMCLKWLAIIIADNQNNNNNIKTVKKIPKPILIWDSYMWCIII